MDARCAAAVAADPAALVSLVDAALAEVAAFVALVDAALAEAAAAVAEFPALVALVLAALALDAAAFCEARAAAALSAAAIAEAATDDVTESWIAVSSPDRYAGSFPSSVFAWFLSEALSSDMIWLIASSSCATLSDPKIVTGEVHAAKDKTEGV